MCVKMQYVYRNKYNGNKKREAEELVVRVLVSGGGTGGHIYPALALIREIKKLNPEARFLYIGTENGLESTTVPITISGLKRRMYRLLSCTPFRKRITNSSASLFLFP